MLYIPQYSATSEDIALIVYLALPAQDAAIAQTRFLIICDLQAIQPSVVSCYHSSHLLGEPDWIIEDGFSLFYLFSLELKHKVQSPACSGQISAFSIPVSSTEVWQKITAFAGVEHTVCVCVNWTESISLHTSPSLSYVRTYKNFIYLKVCYVNRESQWKSLCFILSRQV